MLQGIPVDEIKRDGRSEEDGGGDSVAYRFSERDWDVARKMLKGSGKWYLD
jgi:hypothetical protein